MSDVISNTTPLQYLHQLGLLHALPAMVGRLVVPAAVVDELAVGRSFGLDLPDPATLAWVEVRTPARPLSLPNADALRPGESEVLALAMETVDAEVLIDDLAGRRAAEGLGLRLRGTLGILLDAKKAALIPSVAPLLDQLRALGFRLDSKTRSEVLKRAGESS